MTAIFSVAAMILLYCFGIFITVGVWLIGLANLLQWAGLI